MLDKRGTARKLRIEVIKVFYAWLRKTKHLLTYKDDPTIGDLPVPQSAPEKHKHSKIIPQKDVLAARAHMSDLVRDAIDVTLATAWHGTEVRLFAIEGTIIERPKRAHKDAWPKDVAAVLEVKQKTGGIERWSIRKKALEAAKRLKAHGKLSPASLPPDVDGGMPPPPIDAGSQSVDAGPTPFFTAASPHPSLYRQNVSTCATNTKQDLACPQLGYGLEDGDFQPNARTLQQKGEEIADPATGLSWQLGDSGATTFEQADALSYCASFSTSSTPAGAWRLPSVVELFTISDSAVDSPSTNTLFQGTQGTNYWTSSVVLGNPKLAWTVKFDYGEVIPLLLDTTLPARCVHGPPLMNANGSLRLAGPLVANGVTVVDSTTGLEWQRQDDGNKRSWKDALNYCAELSLSDKTDWHLPNIDELFGIVAYDTGSVYSVAIDPVFQNPQSDLYWTSTQNEGSPTLSWSVNFNLGVVDGVTVTGVAYARCVRHLWSGNVGAPDAGSGHSVKPACGCSNPGAAGLGLFSVFSIALRRRRRTEEP